MKWQQGNILIFLASWIGYSEKQNTYEMRKGVIFMRTNKKLMLGVLSALMVGATSAYAAQSAEVLYSDVPADHWAVKAITQLNQEGIVTGYGDGTFRGDRAVTRYEMAQLIASARSHEQQANNEQKAMIEKLSAEFSEDLESIGMRVTKLEEKSDNVKVSGGFAQKAMKGIADPHTWWEKALWLNIDGQMTNGWRAHAGFDWKYGSNDGFNSERHSSDDYVGGDNMDVAGSIWELYATGPVANNLDIKFGHFAPSLQSGYVSNARIYGGEIDYTLDNKTTVKAYGGKIREKAWDMAIKGNQGFQRNGGYGMAEGGDSYKNASTGWNYGKEIPTAYGVSVEHKFNDKLSGGLGYYNYKTIAYNNERLNIGVVDGSYQLSDKWALTGFYSQGSKGYQNKAGDVKLTYNGSAWGGKKYGGYLGYRYLGADAIIMSSLVHGSEKGGAKGVEGGLWYRFSPSILLTNDFFYGQAINQDLVDETNKGNHLAYFSALNFTF